MMTTVPPARPRTGGVIGRPLPRVEDDPLLRGQAIFCGDVQLPNMLDVAFVRSYVAHGVIVSVDVLRARDVNGVEAVLLAADVPLELTPPLAPPNGGAGATSRPLLPRGPGRYTAQPGAAGRGPKPRPSP